MSESFKRDRDELADVELAALYRKTQDLEPPSRLDSRILTAAREAVRPRKVRRIRRWMVPLSMAAVLVLAIGLVSLMKHQLSPDAVMSIREFSSEKKAESIPLPSASAPGESAGDRQAPRSLSGAPALEQESGRREPPPPPAQPSADAFTDQRTVVPREERTTDGDASKLEGRRYEPVPPPEVWLERIAELRRQGRTAEAEASLKALRRHYPDYPASLPETADE